MVRNSNTSALLLCITITCLMSLGSCLDLLQASSNATLQWDGGLPICNCTITGWIQAPTFGCNFGGRGDWANGTKTFSDPTPAESQVTGIKRYGTFNCKIFSAPLEVFLVINDNIILNTHIKHTSPCLCGNCVSVVSFPQVSSSNFRYYPGATNSFQIIVADNELCLSRVDLSFSYTM